MNMDPAVSQTNHSSLAHVDPGGCMPGLLLRKRFKEKESGEGSREFQTLFFWILAPARSHILA